MIRLLINGINGRMGRALMEAAEADGGFIMAGGVDTMPCPPQGEIPIYKTLKEAMPEADVLVDFSRPEALPGILSFATDHYMPVVLATTGYTGADMARVKRAARRIPIFFAANMSLGVNLLIGLAETSAAFLGAGCDIEIMEAHHNQKADAPSGTALMIADAINKVYENEKEYVYGRHTRSNRRALGEIGIHALRGGTMVGEHAVSYFMNNETVTIKHSAQSRAVYAQGALRAARFITGRPPGLYDMHDMLLEKSSVTRVRAQRGVAMISLDNLPFDPGSMAAVFDCMAGEGVNLDMISYNAVKAGEMGISFSLSEAEGAAAVAALANRFKHAGAQLVSPLVKVTVEGLGMERQPGVASRVFALLRKLCIIPHMVTTSLTEISLLIDVKDEFVALDAFSGAFLS
jgi:4-hydroxy-tetrahydrodipicolinate reductase